MSLLLSFLKISCLYTSKIIIFLSKQMILWGEKTEYETLSLWLYQLLEQCPPVSAEWIQEF